MKSGLAACLLALLSTPTLAQDLEVRFCPEQAARSYSLDSQHGVQSLLIQNIAVLNRGAAPVELEAVDIELVRSGAVVDRRTLAGDLLAGAVRSGQAAKTAGLMDLLPAQFCDGRLLGRSALATSPTLAAGEGLLVMQQAFAWRGARDHVRASVRGRRAGQPVAGAAEIVLDGTTSKTVFRWPLGPGLWTVGSASSFHTTHRWAVPEEFALDLLQFGPTGKSHRGDGRRNSDFLAYGQPVLAAADGKVAGVVTGALEAAPMLPGPGEALDAYYARLTAQQAKNIAAGLPGLVGETVILDHGQGEYSVYAHLVPGSAKVRVGQVVRAGEPIGRLGSSGNSTEPHLHFQICDRPDAVSCAGIAPTFVPLDIVGADGPRPLQSGDIVRGR